MFAQPAATERVERELQAAPCGKEVASFPPSAQWMRELGAVMENHGLTNSTAVLIGSEDQLYMLDTSPRARIGETEHDPSTEEFPVRLYRVATTSPRMRPSTLSPLSPRTRLPSPSMRIVSSPSPPRTTGSEGCE